jgi:hypothetical protein
MFVDFFSVAVGASLFNYEDQNARRRKQPLAVRRTGAVLGVTCYNTTETEVSPFSAPSPKHILF